MESSNARWADYFRRAVNGQDRREAELSEEETGESPTGRPVLSSEHEATITTVRVRRRPMSGAGRCNWLRSMQGEESRRQQDRAYAAVVKVGFLV